MLDSLTRTDNDFSRLLLRLALGGVMFPHGAQKLFGWFGGRGWEETLAFFSQQFGLPPLLVGLLIVTESVGSLLLILGLFTRLMALAIGAVMVSAVVLVHARIGFFANWYGTQQGEGFEFHVLAIGIALALIIGGGGRWSIDRTLMRKTHRPGYMPY